MKSERMQGALERVHEHDNEEDAGPEDGPQDDEL